MKLAAARFVLCLAAHSAVAALILLLWPPESLVGYWPGYVLAMPLFLPLGVLAGFLSTSAAFQPPRRLTFVVASVGITSASLVLMAALSSTGCVGALFIDLAAALVILLAFARLTSVRWRA